MGLEDVIDDVIKQRIKTVWFYQTEDSTGARAFQLLNLDGDELAWRWVTDGCGRWRTQPSLLRKHNAVPADATDFDLPSERLQLLLLDIANGSAG